jgi:hypothetical protein
MPVIKSGFRLALAAYTAAEYPAGPEPRIMRGECFAIFIELKKFLKIDFIKQWPLKQTLMAFFLNFFRFFYSTYCYNLLTYISSLQTCSQKKDQKKV